MERPNEEELWRLAFEHSPVGMCLVGLDGALLVVNRSMCDLLGCEAETLRTKGIQQLANRTTWTRTPRSSSAVAGEIDSPG